VSGEETPHPELPPITQIDAPRSPELVSLIDAMAGTGFNAKRLANACHIYHEMVRTEGCVKFLALSGAMVPVGLQKVVFDLIDLGFVDVLVTTGANCTHDLAEALGFRHRQGHTATAEEGDEALHEEAINRIYDVFMPNEVYESMEQFIQGLDITGVGSVKEMLWRIGESLPQTPGATHSILGICARKRIPIYVPAFTDCGLAIQLWFAHQDLNLNHFQDLAEIINLAWSTTNAGVCIVGGGVPKNFIFQALQFGPNNARFAIQISTDVMVSAGGLSSAELREAVSWGKVHPQARYTEVYVDATVALPLILSYLKTQRHI
jgi:deoxyhypusine synthase